MEDRDKHYAVIFDPENGFQLLDLSTDEVADLAVLESTWRRRGEEVPEGTADEVRPRGSGELNPEHTEVLQYGALRIRSTGIVAYAIADPRVSLKHEYADPE
jgi:hypothetical protein